jgi:hypothetical protein
MLRFRSSLLDVKESATTGLIEKLIKDRGGDILSENGLVAHDVSVDVRMFLDQLDIPTRSVIHVTGGPQLIFKYTWDNELVFPTYQQAFLMGRITVELDRRFSRTSNSLQNLFDRIRPIDDLAYAVADCLRKQEGKVEFRWRGTWQPITKGVAVVNIIMISTLIVFQGKIRVALERTRQLPIEEWTPKS